jgi:2-polyprenyl-3-methyl-5-hydroxy-6-metoxy-1,4-benzoquinol methylase
MTLKTKASIPRTPKTATRTIWETGGKVLRVLDVGCGPGIYVAALAQQGLDAHGVDVDPATPYERVDVFSDDFARHYDGYDLCLCLEVAEHLPEAKADEFVARLVRVAPTIIFSAAVPGQGGHGHINCQPKEYWEQKFNAHNYVQDIERTQDLIAFMRQGYHMGWLVHNVQVFRAYGAVCFAQIIAEEAPQASRLAEYIKQVAW